MARNAQEKRRHGMDRADFDHCVILFYRFVALLTLAAVVGGLML